MNSENILKNYEIGKSIADGGQGLVREARRISDDKRVVVKQYSETSDIQDPEEFWDSDSGGRIGARREVNFLERAKKDNLGGVPNIIEYGMAGPFNQPVVIFEPIQGNTLDTIVSDEAYIPCIENLKKVAKGVGDVLNYAHNLPKPVVHRDIKPDAIFLNGEKVTLGDWATSTPTSGKTRFRTQLLTLYFTAPEITEGRAFDGRADVYSLGKVMQYMLLGENVFEMTNGEPSIKDFGKMNVPRMIVKSLEKATAKDPDKRYNTIEEFCDDLTGSLEKKDLSSKVLETSVKRKNIKRIQERENIVEEIKKYLAFNETLVRAGRLKIRRLSGSFVFDTHTGDCRNCGSTKISEKFIPYTYRKDPDENKYEKNVRSIKVCMEHNIGYFCRSCKAENEDVDQLASNFHKIFDGL